MISNEQAAGLGWTPLGSDANGEQVFSLVDSAGTQKNWIISGGQNHLLPDGPLKGRTAAFLFTLDEIALHGWTANGYDSAGFQLFTLTDDAGTVKNWKFTDGGQISWLADGKAGGAYVPPANPGPFPPIPGGAVIPNGETKPGASPFFDPTHRLLGYDAAGQEVWGLIDEAGTSVEWIQLPAGGISGLHPVSPSSPTLVKFSSKPTGGNAPASSSSKTLLVIGGVALVLLFATNRKKSA